MYYYAVIELETGICYEIIESEEPIIDEPSCIEIGSNDQSYMIRKKYVDGVWENTTPAEAQQFEGSYIGIFGEWLDDVINGKANINHIHNEATTSENGLMSVADKSKLDEMVFATVSEVQTYLGI